jgi:DNA-directed RNA polymerase subunit RPC12/RpoP
MALSLSCPCGAAFEVEDTFAGQGIACPDCGAALRVPLPRPPQLRTSGFAVASVVLALVGAFTVVGTAAAAVLGAIALASIARHRDRLSGAGFAVLGIVLGVGLTAVTGFAFSRGEVFDRLREQAAAGQVDRSGPMEVVRPRDGYAITRPSHAWGVATAEYAQQLDAGDDLVLANPARNAFIEVSLQNAGRQTLDQFRESFLNGYRAAGPGQRAHFTDFSLREARRLPPLDGAEVAEVVFDVKLLGQSLTYQARLVKPRAGTTVYAVIAWTHRRRLEQIEPEVRRGLDSFRLLPAA